MNIMGTLPVKNGAGYDLISPVDAILNPLSITFISLDMASEFSSELVAVIKDRSSMAKRGIHVLGGVIDSDYRGKWGVLLYNCSTVPVQVNAGDRIAQFLLVKISNESITPVSELSTTERGEGGFGSTGR
jgi:dUTP pyrophosphatase